MNGGLFQILTPYTPDGGGGDTDFPGPVRYRRRTFMSNSPTATQTQTNKTPTATRTQCPQTPNKFRTLDLQ